MSAFGEVAAGAPRIAIHAGLKKAGSATIQTFFSANAEALREMGVDFPEVGRAERKAHHNIFSELMEKPAFDPSRGGLAEFAAHVRAGAHGLVVMSSEMLEGLPPAKVAALKNGLAPTGRPMVVVLILRNLMDLIPSSYAQKVRHGQKSHDFDRFFAGRMAEERVSYFTTARNWADIFGWENIRVRLLDSGALLNGDLIDDVLASIGLDPDDPRLRTLPRPGVVNAASGWKVLEAVRALSGRKSPLPPGHPLAEILSHATTLARRKKIERAAVAAGNRLGWQGDRGLYLQREQAQTLLDLYAESIVALNERLTQPLPPPGDLAARGFVERPFLPTAGHIPREELMAFYDDVAAGLSDMKRLRRPPREGKESRRNVAPPPGVVSR